MITKNKEKIISIIMIVLLFLTLSIHINCIYRNEATTFFDRFTLVDLFNKYKKQLENNRCSITEGPDCFHLSSLKNISSDSEYLLQVINRLLMSETTLNTNNVLNLLKTELKKFKENNKISMSLKFKLSPKILMNLLLTFESFDETTKINDVYMPREKIINFNVGYLKMNFIGKLRLTSERESTIKKYQIIKNTPTATYGIIEDKDLLIKFDKPVIINYLYARPHLNEIDNNVYKNFECKVVGYTNENVVFEAGKHIIENKREWYQITPPSTNIDTLRLPVNFEVDDISISHQSEYSGTGDNNNHLSSILKTMIKDILEKSNKNNILDDDL